VRHIRAEAEAQKAKAEAEAQAKVQKAKARVEAQTRLIEAYSQRILMQGRRHEIEKEYNRKIAMAGLAPMASAVEKAAMTNAMPGKVE